jgi:hypothetical protein
MSRPPVKPARQHQPERKSHQRPFLARALWRPELPAVQFDGRLMCLRYRLRRVACLRIVSRAGSQCWLSSYGQRGLRLAHNPEFALAGCPFVLLDRAPDAIFELTISLGQFCRDT